MADQPDANKVRCAYVIYNAGDTAAELGPYSPAEVERMPDTLIPMGRRFYRVEQIPRWWNGDPEWYPGKETPTA